MCDLRDRFFLGLGMFLIEKTEETGETKVGVSIWRVWFLFVGLDQRRERERERETTQTRKRQDKNSIQIRLDSPNYHY